MSALTKYDEALKTMPAPGGAGCHVAIMGAANLGVIAGVGERQVFDDIRKAIPQGSRNVPDSEIIKTVRKAFGEVIPSDGKKPDRWGGNPVPPKPAFDGLKERQRVIDISQGVQEVDLWEISPVRLDAEPGAWEAVVFLESLYGWKEHVFVGDIYDTAVFTVAEHIAAIENNDKTYPHIIPNPMTGEIASGGNSYRCDLSVSAFRFAVVEFDDMSIPDQIAFWHTMVAVNNLDVACLIDSGGKSIHAWLRVNLSTRVEWDERVKEGLYDKNTGYMAILGADRACQNPSRLSRLPGHYRGDKRKMQRLLYLNPQKTKSEAI